jgi:predicted nucleotidyltransferase
MKPLKDLATKYKLSLILLFGSHVYGDVNTESDMDIAIYGKKVLSEADKIDLTYEFSKIFHKDKIDVVDIKTSPPLLKKEIFKDYKILYQRNRTLVRQLELVSLFEFRESEILYQIRHERLQEFIR